MGCAGGAGWQDNGGLPVLRALKVRVAILYLVQASIGSQWSTVHLEWMNYIVCL